MIILFGSTGFIGKSISKKINKNIINYNSKNLNLENLKQIKKIAKKSCHWAYINFFRC